MRLIPNLKSTILLVDDEPINLKVLKNILKDDYILQYAKDGEAAITIAKNELPSLILLDVMMPDITGHSVCKQLKEDPNTKHIPIIFVTALSDDVDEVMGLELGAVDYITKPVSASIVKARVKTHLSLVQADELRESRLKIIQTLGKASEYKDNETGMHVLRMSHYAKIIATSYGFGDLQVDNLFNAAPMHDIGKIGIPDSILLKPGRLTDDEMTIMKRHSEIGAEIIGDCDSEILTLAKSIALSHHEKWDGSGYPKGLSQEEIPIEGRIVAVADVFDALTSKRPYKDAWPIEDAINYIKENSGKHFDPNIVDLFLENIDSIIEIKERFKD